MISKKSLDKFKKLYKRRFKKELSDAEVLQRATRILNLYRIIYGPNAFYQSQKLTNENEYKQKSN